MKALLRPHPTLKTATQELEDTSNDLPLFLTELREEAKSLLKGRQ